MGARLRVSAAAGHGSPSQQNAPGGRQQFGFQQSQRREKPRSSAGNNLRERVCWEPHGLNALLRSQMKPFLLHGAAREQPGAGTAVQHPRSPPALWGTELQPGVGGGLGVKGIPKGARNLSACWGGSLWMSA